MALGSTSSVPDEEDLDSHEDHERRKVERRGGDAAFDKILESTQEEFDTSMFSTKAGSRKGKFNYCNL